MALHLYNALEYSVKILNFPIFLSQKTEQVKKNVHLFLLLSNI